MSKILLCSDLHVHPHKKSHERLRHCIDVLDWIFKTAKQKKISDIIFLGDLFHDRHKIDVMTYQWTFEIFRRHLEDSSMQIWLLLGNHDMFHLQKTDISSVRPLDAIKNVHIIDKPCTITISGRKISFLPYTNDPIDDLNVLEEENEDFFRILCGHLAVDNGTLNSLWQTKSEVSIEHDGDMVVIDANLFGCWDQVFLGHYHAAQTLDGKVEYLGSPLELSFGETEQEKHILVYDLETHEKEYVVNDFSPKHYIIPLEDVDKYDVGNNFVKFIVDDIASAKIAEIKSELAAKNPGSIEFYQKPKLQEDKDAIDEARELILTNSDIVEQYVDATKDRWESLGLDRDKLIAIGKEIMSKRQ